jgi:hypothetical protein
MIIAEGVERRIVRVRRRAFCILLTAAVVSGCGQSPPSIHVDASNPSRPFIEVRGLAQADLSRLANANLTPDEWSSLLRVSIRSTQPGNAGEMPAMAGRYTVEGTLRFWPSFPLDPGREYEVRFDPSNLARAGVDRGKAVVGVVSIPAVNRQPSTSVSAVHPSGDVIPENNLRMYITFSSSMGQQGGLDHIAFVDDGGREVPDVVLPLDTELWNAERTRYTVILDPGRVKKDILPNRRMGRPLHDGEGITVVVKRDWLDASGTPLVSEFKHRYRVGPAEEEPLHTADWRIAPPAAGTRDPVTVTFPKPLDYGLLQRSLAVSRGSTTLTGDLQIANGETRWEFVPHSEWQRGPYILTILPILEDLAGNRIGRAFEVMSKEDAVAPESSAPVSVPFIVR